MHGDGRFEIVSGLFRSLQVFTAPPFLDLAAGGFHPDGAFFTQIDTTVSETNAAVGTFQRNSAVCRFLELHTAIVAQPNPTVAAESNSTVDSQSNSAISPQPNTTIATQTDSTIGPSQLNSAITSECNRRIVSLMQGRSRATRVDQIKIDAGTRRTHVQGFITAIGLSRGLGAI